MAAIGIENPQYVAIAVSRWAVTIRIVCDDGGVEQYVASADSAFADSGIWFGPQDEYAEAVERAF